MAQIYTSISGFPVTVQVTASGAVYFRRWNVGGRRRSLVTVSAFVHITFCMYTMPVAGIPRDVREPRAAQTEHR